MDSLAGKGVPNERACDNKRTGAILSHEIPTVEAASDMYRNATAQPCSVLWMANKIACCAFSVLVKNNDIDHNFFN